MSERQNLPNDLELSAMAALAHWHSRAANIKRKEPIYLGLIRQSLEKRELMPYQLAKRGLDFDVLVGMATRGQL